ncbi:hypothetical protein H7198_06195 [Fructobacillus sp. CRL 2054]|uniref:EbsA family protein n=1 Tax=Fructobacillus sp. CRL 2054 TaxID=2763007 RepID=UPI0023782B5B|nr:EbsA family protein [Fructobacillus sp. CRL 2054]MDD9139192.1 hypothetical protein [Fructobacillus sp. CRL 2054]
MTKIKAYYQPASDWAAICWLIWGCFLAVSPIWASELFYKVDGLWLAYTVFIVLVGIYRFGMRRLVFDKKYIQILQLRFWKMKIIELGEEGQSAEVDGRTLTIKDENGKEKRYRLTRRSCRKIKDELNEQQ